MNWPVDRRPRPGSLPLVCPYCGEPVTVNVHGDSSDPPAYCSAVPCSAEWTIDGSPTCGPFPPTEG